MYNDSVVTLVEFYYHWIAYVPRKRTDEWLSDCAPILNIFMAFQVSSTFCRKLAFSLHFPRRISLFSFHLFTFFFQDWSCLWPEKCQRAQKVLEKEKGMRHDKFEISNRWYFSSSMLHPSWMCALTLNGSSVNVDHICSIDWLALSVKNEEAEK